MDFSHYYDPFSAPEKLPKLSLRGHALLIFTGIIQWFLYLTVVPIMLIMCMALVRGPREPVFEYLFNVGFGASAFMTPYFVINTLIFIRIFCCAYKVYDKRIGIRMRYIFRSGYGKFFMIMNVIPIYFSMSIVKLHMIIFILEIIRIIFIRAY